jgi:hypothetical protein
MSKSTPKAPDYEAAAAQQAQSSKEVTEQQTWANRPDQFTPFGQQYWQNQQVWDPATNQYLNRWAQTTELNPESQRALDAQMGLTTGRSELGASLFPRMQDEFGNAMDWSQFRGPGDVVDPGQLDSSEKYRQSAEDAIYGQWADRALPQQARDTENLRTQLYNTGLREGDQAYDEEMRKLRESQGDQMAQAQYRATTGSGTEAQRMLGMDAQAQAQNFGQGMTASNYETQLRQQQIAEEMQKRGFSLNEINAIISGQQVGMPSMPGFNQAQRSEGNQALQAAQLTGQAELDRYNAKQQATQGMMEGVGGIAGGFMPSDRRLKTDVKFLGKLSGVNIYEWTYLWGEKSQGVMADEVPWAVAGEVAGFKVVDYRRVW